jgi:ABC-type Mn2+/Zn2+ transport system permease subunit
MLDLILLPFFQRALIIGVILSVLMAIVGVFVVLRRMSFFSDAIGHAALTGIALGLLLHINPYLSALIFTLVIAIGISLAASHTKLPLDTLLGVLFSSSVALGVILMQLTPGYQSDLISFLFGDILAVSQFDIYLTIVVSLIALIIIIISGKHFIAITFDANLAQAEGINVKTYELLFMLLLAGLIALAIKLVGVVLVTALLVIPAATAQNLTRSLTSMFTGSVALSLVSMVFGLFLSATLNTPSGPTVVLVGSVLFIISLLLRPLVKSA